MYRRLGWTPPSAYIMFRYESYTAKELGKRTRTVEALFFRETLSGYALVRSSRTHERLGKN